MVAARDQVSTQKEEVADLKKQLADSQALQGADEERVRRLVHDARCARCVHGAQTPLQPGFATFVYWRREAGRHLYLVMYAPSSHVLAMGS